MLHIEAFQDLSEFIRDQLVGMKTFKQECIDGVFHFDIGFCASTGEIWSLQEGHQWPRDPYNCPINKGVNHFIKLI